jgi:hypothetical protein
MGVQDVGEQASPPPDQVLSSAEQVAGGAQLGRIDVGLWQGSPAKQGRDLEGVDLVVLGLSAVDRPHEQGVAEDELDALPAAQIGQPVPGEDALGGDHEVVTVGRNGREKGLGAALQVLVEEDLALPVEDADVHGLCVQIDAAVVVSASRRRKTFSMELS